MSVDSRCVSTHREGGRECERDHDVIYMCAKERKSLCVSVEVTLRRSSLYCLTLVCCRKGLVRESVCVCV